MTPQQLKVYFRTDCDPVYWKTEGDLIYYKCWRCLRHAYYVKN